jgi:hypothetical protein
MYSTSTPDSAFTSARNEGIRHGISLLNAGIFEREELAADHNVGATDFDPDLWEHVAHLVEDGRWGQVATECAVFLESKVREWAGLSAGDYGKSLMIKVFKPDGGKFPCGQTDGEVACV